MELCYRSTLRNYVTEIYYGRYIATDILGQIYYSRYIIADIYIYIYIKADVLWQIYYAESSRLLHPNLLVAMHHPSEARDLLDSPDTPLGVRPGNPPGHLVMHTTK